MDDFRKEQRAQAPYGYDGSTGPYGCTCCMTSSLNNFKKHARNIAKVRFKRIVQKEINKELMQYDEETKESKLQKAS